VVWKDQVVGGLAAMLVGRAFTPEDLTALTRVGDLIGLELAEANALWRAQRQGQDAEAKLKASRDLQAIIRKERDPEQLLERATEDRRQALVLYELSRFATLGNDPHNDLESAVAMLADNLRHDAVGVWAAEEHHLHLRAATGYGDVIPSDISTSGTDTVLAQ